MLYSEILTKNDFLKYSQKSVLFLNFAIFEKTFFESYLKNTISRKHNFPRNVVIFGNMGKKRFLEIFSKMSPFQQC